MVEATQREQWNHTSMICGVIANANRDPDKPMIDPRMFHLMERDAVAGGESIEVDCETVGTIAKSYPEEDEV